LSRIERYRVHSSLLQRAQHFFPARFRQMVGEEAAVADDDAHCHFLV